MFDVRSVRTQNMFHLFIQWKFSLSCDLYLVHKNANPLIGYKWETKGLANPGVKGDCIAAT